MKKRKIVVLKYVPGEEDITGETQGDTWEEDITVKGQIAPGISTDELSPERLKIDSHITAYIRGFYGITGLDRIRLYEKDNTFVDWMIDGNPALWDSQLFPTRKWTVLTCERVEG